MLMLSATSSNAFAPQQQRIRRDGPCQLWRGGRRLRAFAAAAHEQAQTSAAGALLTGVRVVLVAPKTAANVGAAVRLCANFEVAQLAVVAPRCQIDGEDDVTRLARAGPASSAILDSMQVHADLAAALADTTGSIGFTRRAGATRLTYASVSHLLSQAPDALPGTTLAPALRSSDADTSVGRAGVVALVFGREESGLTEAELRLCKHACGIPTGAVQGSMNLSHAVAVVLSEVYQRRQAVAELHALSPADRQLALAGLLHPLHPSAPALAALPLVVGMGGGLVPGPPPGRSSVTAPAQPTPSASGVGGVGQQPRGSTSMVIELQPPHEVQAELGMGGSLGPAVYGNGGLQGQQQVGLEQQQHPPVRRAQGGTAPHQQQQQPAEVSPQGVGVGRAAEGAGGSSSSVDESLLPATAAEVEALQGKLVVIARAAGDSGEESRGGHNHGRRRLALGHVRALLSRAQPRQGEVRSLHGLASKVLAALGQRDQGAARGAVTGSKEDGDGSA